MKFFKTCILCALFSLLAVSAAWRPVHRRRLVVWRHDKENASVVVFLANGSFY